MRLTRLSLLAAALLAGPALAQPSVGVRLGLAVSDLDFSNGGFEAAEGIDQQPRLGLALGVAADLPLSPAVSLRPEVLYAQKGYVLDVDFQGQDPISSTPFDFRGTQRFEIDYVEIPLLLAYRIPTGSALDVAVEAGPSLAFKLNATFECEGSAELVEACPSRDAPEDRDDVFDELDLGAVLGLTAGAGPFDVSLRYAHGFRSVYGSELADDGLTAYNRVATVSGTYRFGL